MLVAPVFRKLLLVACVTSLLVTLQLQLLIHNGDQRSQYAYSYPEVSWEKLSNNRFSYNICSLPYPEGRRTERERSGLPLAHRTLLNRSRLKSSGGCSQAPKTWERGVVTDLLPERTVSSEMCHKLFLGEKLDQEDKEWIETTNKMLPKRLNTYQLLHDTSNCDWVRQEFRNNFHVTQKEKDFAIAYSITVHSDPHQVLRFLKVIYRPHNVYCLHFDKKSKHSFKQVFFNLASCLDNVLVPRRIESVYWGWYTLMEAQFSCLSDLLLAREDYPWRYVITLCGKELPLRTNAEIVSMLEPLNGTSSVHLEGLPGLDQFKFKWRYSLNPLTGWVTKRDLPSPPVPGGLEVHKSWAYLALSHLFVEHLLCSALGRELREFMRGVRIPEENIYAMLYMAPGTPGGYRPEVENKTFPIISCIWMDGDHRGLWRRVQMFLYPSMFCSGTVVHNICIVGAADLYKLPYMPGVRGYQDVDSYLSTGGAIVRYKGPDRGPPFYNKYSMKRDHVVMDCMESELVRRNKLEYETECES